MAPLDLHVLGTPPAFVLSQDQTLDKLVIYLTLQLYTYLGLLAHLLTLYFISTLTFVFVSEFLS